MRKTLSRMPVRRIAPLATILTAAVLGASCADSTSPLPAEGGVRVLFIGNSLTYANDLPRTIADLAKSVNDTPLVYRTIAKPNYALEDHYYEDVASRIGANDWEFVVMQQGPSASTIGAVSLASWSAELDRFVTAAGARSVIYQVWPGGTDSVPFVAVRTSHRDAAQAIGGMLIPAGDAWLDAWDADPTLALYADDDFHPSRLGTYLTALVHFEMLYGRPATDLPDIAVVAGRRLDVPAATVQLLQQAAHTAVLEWGVP